MAKVYLYNIREAEILSRLKAVLLRRGVGFREVDPLEYGHPLGYLCGREGYAPAQPYDGPGFSEPMLLLAGFAPPELSALLDELRARHVSIPLKAVVTDTNAAWSSLALHDAILEEHRAMQACQASKKKTK